MKRSESTRGILGRLKQSLSLTAMIAATFAVGSLGIGNASAQTETGSAQSTASQNLGAIGSGNSYGNWTDNPYHPAYNHPWRHGATPTIDTLQKMKDWRANQHTMSADSNDDGGGNELNPGKAGNTQPSASAGQLSFGGGVNGVGVLSGQSKVYLVFYGSQWGTQTTDANGYLNFSGDSAGAAVAVQKMFKGIGTNNELWSADLTQWCDGPNVASGATSCPSNANFIPYQQNVFAGVWYDNASASPSSATAAQLGNEAVAAAAHFGNTTAASNRYTYYIILSPHGTNPDNYQSPINGYCAWHDYTADAGVSSPYGELAFSNQPYNIDSGASCGTNFINTGSAGTLDGYTMTLGHEWHEMMSDQYPSGGWTNHSTNRAYQGQENSDECAWIAPGSAGGAANITFATGTFAEQASWSNDTGNCAISHVVVNHSGGGTGGSTTIASNLSASKGNWTSTYTYVIPSGKTGTISIAGGTGDADLYVKLGSAPTTTSYTCRPYLSGNNESCANLAAGTYYIKVNAYATFSGVTLTGSTP